MTDTAQQGQMDPQVAAEAMRHGIPLAREGMLKAVGQRIQNNKHLAEFLSGVPIAKRRQAYEEVREHLNFVPRSYTALAAQAAKASKRRRRGP